jgi:hypothetical protein
MSGAIFSDYKLVKELIEKISTDTGLTVVVRLNLKEYQKGIPIDKKQIDQKRILKHPIIPELSYRMIA